VCGTIRTRVYIGAQQRNPRQGHAHVARPSRLQQPTIWEQPEPASCDASVKDSVKCSACRDETSERGWGGGARVWYFSSHSLTNWCNTPPYMLVYIFLTFHVGLNLAPTSCFWAAKNLGCMSHGLTHMDFEISRNFWNLIWAYMKRPNISTVEESSGRLQGRPDIYLFNTRRILRVLQRNFFKKLYDVWGTWNVKLSIKIWRFNWS
jgi:hypothetical protein